MTKKEKNKKEIEEVKLINKLRLQINPETRKTYTLAEIAKKLDRSIYYVHSRVDKIYSPKKLR